MPNPISAHALNLFWKLWYPLVSRIARHEPLHFLNYGYADPPGTPPIPLDPADETNRPCIQLYHHVASLTDLRDLDALEVSCGHGGGAAYIAQYLKPKSMLAVDRNPAAIKFCRRSHHSSPVQFSQANALALPFPDNSFDALLNIEASHCYPDLPKFLSEVRRLLKPAGHFLFADFRDLGPPLATLQHQLQTSGLQLLSCDDISQHVLRGMQLNSDKYLAWIHKLLPKPLHKPAIRFAGVKGSQIYAALQSGQTRYLCYHLQNPAPQTEKTLHP